MGFLGAFASAFLAGDFLVEALAFSALVEPFGLPRPFLAIGFKSSLSGSALRFCEMFKLIQAKPKMGDFWIVGLELGGVKWWT